MIAKARESFFFMYSHSFVKFQFISLLNYIIRLQYMQEKSRQTLLPGPKGFCEHLPYGRRLFYCFQGFMV